MLLQASFEMTGPHANLDTAMHHAEQYTQMINPMTQAPNFHGYENQRMGVPADVERVMKRGNSSASNQTEQWHRLVSENRGVELPEIAQKARLNSDSEKSDPMRQLFAITW